ncbi:S9 family peptidase [Myxococcota bacterium]|nr:S9 family peptidase [Myxococcota bacterium]
MLPDPLPRAEDPREPLPPIHRYLNVLSSGRPQWSADGERVLYLTRTSGTNQVWSLPREGGIPQQVTFFEDDVADFATSPVGDVMVLALGRGGDERTRLYRASNDGMWIHPVAVDPGAIHTFGDWSDDGRRIAWSTNARDAATFDVRVLDLGSGQVHRVVEEVGHWSAGEFSPDGHRLLVVRSRSGFDQDLFVARVSTGERRALGAGKGAARYRSPRWSGDGRSVWVLSDQGRDFVGLARVDLGGRSPRPRFVEEGPFDREQLALSPDRRLAAVVSNVDGWSRLELRDLAGGPPTAPPDLPRGVYGSPVFSPDGRRLALTVSGPRLPQDVWIVDVLEGTARPLLRSSRAGVPESSFADARPLRWRSFDGLEIPGLLYVPPRRGAPHPLLALVHGGPEGQARPGFDAVTQYFVRRGYAVLLPNVRGSTGYGKAFSHLDDVERREDSVRDLAEGVRHLVAAGIADPTRVAVMGSSYGGYVVLAALVNHPSLFRAGVDVVGIADFETFLARTGPWRRALRAAEYGDPAKHAELLRRLSPLHRIEAIQAPLLVVHGLNDPRVPVEEAEQVVAAMRRRGQFVEYLRFDDEGHGIAKRANRLRLYPRIASFLDHALGLMGEGDGE